MMDYAMTLTFGGVLHFAKGWNYLACVGAVYLVLLAVDIIMLLMGGVTARIMFTEIYPKSVREIKHNNKQYQYVVNDGKREVYTVAYSKPLDKVKLRCFKYMGQCFVEVRNKKQGAS